MYAIREKNGKRRFLGFCYDAIENPEFSVSVSFSFSMNEGNVWIVDSKETAEFAINNHTPWYNAGYSTPKHDFNPKKFEVVELVPARD